MKVKDLIEKLNKVENKELDVFMMHEFHTDEEQRQYESLIEDFAVVVRLRKDGKDASELMKIVLIGSEIDQ